MSINLNRMRTIQAGVLILACIVTFGNTFQNQFVWDDSYLISDNRHIKGINNIPLFFTAHYWNNLHPFPGQYRPLRTVTFAVDYFFWELNPAGYHLTNLLLHMANVLLVFFMVTLICRRMPVGSDKADADRHFFLSLSFLTALFFALHPVHTESVTYVKNRSELLASFFFFLSCLLYSRPLLNSRPGRLLSDIAAWSCFLLAVLSKETALALPGVLVLYAVCFPDGTGRRKPFLRIMPYGLLIIAYFWFRQAVIGAVSMSDGNLELGFWQHCLSVFKTIGSYFFLLVFPVYLNAEHVFIVPDSIWEPDVLLSAVILLTVGLLAMRLYSRSKTAFFSVGWILLTLLPAANIVFLETRPLAEQRLYLPSFGFCLLLAYGIKRLPAGRHRPVSGSRVAATGLALTSIIVISYAVITVSRNADWRDPQTFYTRTIAANPNSYRIHNNLGIELVGSGQVDAAIRHYLTALKLNPFCAKAYNNLGVVYSDMNRLEESLNHFKIALRLHPDSAEFQNNMSIALLKADRLEEAEAYARAALRLKPDFDRAHVSLGRILSEKGDEASAQSYFTAALDIEPDSAWAYNSIGLYYKKKGRLQQAHQYYTRAAAIDPDYADTYYNLGELFSDQGRLEEAVGYYRRALALKPYFTQAYINLGVTLAELGKYEAAVQSFSEGLKHQPDSPLIHNNLGTALTDSGHVEAAIVHFRTALQLKPDYAEAHVNLGVSLAKSGRVEEAMDHFTTAIQIDPKYVGAYVQMGNLLAGQKDPERAVTYYSSALEIDPDNSKAHNNMGVALIRQGRFDEAVEHFRRALALEPDHVQAAYNLGAALADKGEYSQAVNFLSMAWQADPRLLQAKKRYEECLFMMGAGADQPSGNGNP